MIILHPSEDRFHNLQEQGSYEWTYFDGISEDGEHAFTAIWFRGIPMSPYYTAAIDSDTRDASPGKFCAFAFGLYRNGKRIASGLEEGPEEWFFGDTHSPDAKFRENTLHSAQHPNGTTAFHIAVDIRRPLLAGRILGEIELKFPEHDTPNGVEAYQAGPGTHYWVPAAPDGSFSAALDLVGRGRSSQKIRFSGRAYHDRNLGTEPLHTADVDWHWGRVHFDSRAFVFFDIRSRAEKTGSELAPFQRLLVYENGKLVDQEEGVACVTERWRNHWGTLPYPAAIRSGDAASIIFTAINHGQFDSGPFYHRMAAQFSLRTASGSVQAPGMTEYMRPSRLGISAFRPFVKFRLRRIG